MCWFEDRPRRSYSAIMALPVPAPALQRAATALPRPSMATRARVARHLVFPVQGERPPFVSDQTAHKIFHPPAQSRTQPRTVALSDEF